MYRCSHFRTHNVGWLSSKRKTTDSDSFVNKLPLAYTSRMLHTAFDDPQQYIFSSHHSSSFNSCTMVSSKSNKIHVYHWYQRECLTDEDTCLIATCNWVAWVQNLSLLDRSIIIMTKSIEGCSASPESGSGNFTQVLLQQNHHHDHHHHFHHQQQHHYRHHHQQKPSLLQCTIFSYHVHNTMYLTKMKCGQIQPFVLKHLTQFI